MSPTSANSDEGPVAFGAKEKARFITHAIQAIHTVKHGNKVANHDIESTIESFAKNLETFCSNSLLSESDSCENIEDRALIQEISQQAIDIEELAREIVTDQSHWNLLAEFLMMKQLTAFDPEKDFPVSMPLGFPLELPIFEGSSSLDHVVVEKRFASRKQPHLLTLVNDENEERKYIFKEDDDLSMDVAIMELFRLANQIWKKKGLRPHIQTYRVVATIENSGFCEVIQGTPMLVVTDDEITEQLGSSAEQWETFYWSLVAVMVLTGAYDITDRHDNNVLFCPGGDIALIDLSASLGHRAPMDVVLGMNPVYFPARIRQIHNYYKKVSGDKPLSQNLGWKFWSEVEEDAMLAYFALYNHYDLHAVMKKCGYRLPSPLKFHQNVHRRGHKTSQPSENLRNGIVQTMEDSSFVSGAVSAICKIIPGS